MFDNIFSNDSDSNTNHVIRLVHEYIQRNPCEFLKPIRSNEKLVHDKYKSIDQYWSVLLSLDELTFMKGFKPITHQYKSLYEQLFHHYFEYPVETEKYVRLLQQNQPLQWFPPQWLEHSQPLKSGRMGQVYLSHCRLPWKKTKFIGKLQTCPKEVIGITATRSKQNHRRLAFVSIAAESTLEQLIPQVDQWTFQKTYRTALMIASSVRDFHQQGRIHPNLQPRNIMMFQPNSMTLIDDWPCIPLSSRYGRYPYIAPEICHDHAHIDQQCNVFSLGVILWQLATGVIFPISAPVSPSVYAIDQIEHMDPAYNDIVMRCLSPVCETQQRPTANQVCEALIRILMTEMACPRPLQPHSTCIRERQSKLVKYLAVVPNNEDLQNLMHGSSISKRMMLQVIISLERHHLYWHPSPASIKKQQQGHRRLSQSSTSSSSSEEENHCQDENGCYVLHKKKYKYQKRPYRVHNQQNDASCTNIYGADLPDLMQMGFA